MSERRWREQFCWQTKLFLAPTSWVPRCRTECTQSHTECTQSHTLTDRLRGARREKKSRARTTFGGAKPITGVGTMNVPNQILHAKFSPRLEPYGAFRLHLHEINAWLNAGCSMRSVWIEWKQKGAFPGCYRSFLRYCHKHNLPRSGAVEPENPKPRSQPCRRASVSAAPKTRCDQRKSGAESPVPARTLQWPEAQGCGEREFGAPFEGLSPAGLAATRIHSV